MSHACDEFCVGGGKQSTVNYDYCVLYLCIRDVSANLQYPVLFRKLAVCECGCYFSHLHSPLHTLFSWWVRVIVGSSMLKLIVTCWMTIILPVEWTADDWLWCRVWMNRKLVAIVLPCPTIHSKSNLNIYCNLYIHTCLYMESED